MYSQSQQQVLSAVVDCGAAFSLLGCLFILLAYILFKDLRVYAFKLVVHMTIGDSVRCVGILLQHADHALCVVQAMMIQVGALSSLLWNGVIARTLYLSVVREVREVEEMETRYTIGVYVLVAVLSVLPWTTNDYGDAEGWCWITSFGSHYTTGSVWRMVCYFGPFLLIAANSVCSYCSVISHLRKSFEQSPEVVAMVRRLKFYPLILLLCNSCTFLKRMYDMVAPDAYDYPLAMVAAVMLGLYGLLDAVVYGLTPSVRLSISQSLCPRHSSRRDSLLADSDTALQSPS